MPRILMITTGGTIACRETAHGLSPALDSAALLAELPALAEICTVKTLELMQLDSTDITAADRQRMAQAVWKAPPSAHQEGHRPDLYGQVRAQRYPYA